MVLVDEHVSVKPDTCSMREYFNSFNLLGYIWCRMLELCVVWPKMKLNQSIESLVM